MDIVINKAPYKQAAWERIKQGRANAEKFGFMVNGVRYDCDAISCQRIASAVVLAMLAQQAGAPYSTTWTTYDNSTVTLDAAGMIAVGLACGKHISRIFDQARILRERIEAATTADELDRIQWTNYLPS